MKPRITALDTGRDKPVLEVEHPSEILPDQI
jgi:hypothetical protein